MTVLRRIAAVVAAVALGAQWLAAPTSPPSLVAVVAAAVMGVANELAYWLAIRRGVLLGTVVNVQITLDLALFVVMVHLGGGITNPAVFLLAPMFFVYGSVLPLGQVLAHLLSIGLGLTLLWMAEGGGWVTHVASPYHLPGTNQRADFFALTLTIVGTVTALCACVGSHVTVRLRREEDHGRALESERAALVASNEREGDRVRALLASNEMEAARVRALLDVAQLVSGTASVHALLRAVCETTVDLVGVPRVEVFLWNADEDCLELAASRGLSGRGLREHARYTADVPIVARLRAGEVVDYEAAPAHVFTTIRVDVPFRRGFAAPMVCRGSFEGALFVGYDDERGGELKELVQGIARQAALALVNVRAMEQQHEDAEVSGGLLQISQAISACLDEEALWTLLVRGAAEVLELPWVVAGRFDERSGTCAVAGIHGVPEKVAAGLRERFRLEDRPPLQELLSTRRLVVADESETLPFPVPAGWDSGAWLAIPLFRGSWVAGFLAAGAGTQSEGFSRRQVRLVEGLGQHASIALQNARLVADLEAADKLKSEFVSTMSHELRTPLNVIIGYTEMLREGSAGPVTEEQLDLVNRLDTRGRELLELIEATLHVGRLEAGRDTVELAPLAISELLQALNGSTQGIPRPPGVGVEWEVPSGVGARIMTDRAKLALVVRNLVSNALKFTSEGKVVVRLMLRGDTLVVEVRDTGIGISAEHLPIIFEMFRQVDGSMTRRHGGVGLGLYIVKQFVTRLGGTVDVQSTPGRGSTFRVVLPGVVQGGEASAAA
jgi:signal transduction histidine kinase